MANSIQVATINGIGDFILFLGKLAVGSVCGLVSILWLRNREDVHFYMIPCIFITVFSFFIAHIILSLFEVIKPTFSFNWLHRFQWIWFYCFLDGCWHPIFMRVWGSSNQWTKWTIQGEQISSFDWWRASWTNRWPDWGSNRWRNDSTSWNGSNQSATIQSTSWNDNSGTAATIQPACLIDDNWGKWNGFNKCAFYKRFSFFRGFKHICIFHIQIDQCAYEWNSKSNKIIVAFLIILTYFDV